MDWKALRHLPKAVGIAAAALLLASLLSFHVQDPTLTNLRWPSTGIGNWIGLPGALVGGSLLELLGAAALAAPLLLLNWVLCARNRPPIARYGGWALVLLVAGAGLHGLLLPADAPAWSAPGSAAPGLVGWALRHWAGLTGGPWFTGVVLVYVAGHAATGVLYAPLVHTAMRDARVFAGWLVRAGWRRWGEGWAAMRANARRMHRVAGSGALGLTRGAGAGLLGLAAALLAALTWPVRAPIRWLSAWRSPSLARIKARREEAGDDPWLPAGPTAVAAGAVPAPEGGDAFDHWYGADGTDAGADGAGARSATPPPTGGRAFGEAWREREAALAKLLSGGDDEPEAQGEDDEAPTLAATAPRASPHASALPPEHAREDLPKGSDAAAAAQPEPPDYAFEQPEAEAAWRERFQRYARNLDLDWEEQQRRRQEGEPADDDEAPPPDRER